MTVYVLENPIINNEWGCSKSMVELYGYSNPQNKPLAELWMGAHPKATSSVVLTNNDSKPLNEWIARNPTNILGQVCAAKFSNKLSFLFKVLSADSPLSIQSHPNKLQALAGWEKENAEKIPLTAAHRNYKDDNHKPELVYAITEFHALNGFREYSQIVKLFNLVKGANLSPIINTFVSVFTSQGLKQFYQALMTHPAPAELVNEVINNIKKRLKANIDPMPLKTLWQLIININNKYPGDIGVLSPLLINYIVLQPGEAMFLDAGTLHAYLKGTSLELMANSDNVLRGGLTPKHVDVKELLHTTVFEPKKQSDLKLNATKLNKNEHSYSTNVDDFKLNIIVLSNTAHKVDSVRSAEILFVAEGNIQVLASNGCQVALKAGESCLISAENSSYQLKGTGKVARAYTPIVNTIA